MTSRLRPVMEDYLQETSTPTKTPETVKYN